jgi:hypothetical protein
MLIRPAQYGDELALIEFSKICYEQMGFDNVGYKFEYATGLRNYWRGITNPDILILTGWEKGSLVALAVWIMSDKSQYFDNHKIATEHVFHALPTLPSITQLKIMSELEIVSCKRLKEKEVKTVYFSYDLRFPTVGKLFEKHGHRAMAVQMHKEL